MMLDGVIPPKWRCPICNKRCKDERGVTMHMIDKHKNPKHLEKITEWLANPTRTASSA
jgi:hypothetical protein